MKQCFFALLVLAFIGCNDHKTTAQTTVANEQHALKTSAATETASGGGCGSLILFQKGAVITGATYDASGKEIAKQTTVVSDVSEAGGMTVSNVKQEISTSRGNKEMEITYKCDGEALYSDLKSMVNFMALKDSKVESSDIKFPIHLTVGQTLPPASVTITTDRGNMSIKMTSTHTDRKVVGTEEVTTPAGTWKCYKVASRIETVSEYGGQKKANITSPEMILWFAPDFGVVKSQTIVKGKVEENSMIISVKK